MRACVVLFLCIAYNYLLCTMEVVFNLINVKRFFQYSYEEKIRASERYENLRFLANSLTQIAEKLKKIFHFCKRHLKDNIYADGRKFFLCKKNLKIR